MLALNHTDTNAAIASTTKQHTRTRIYVRTLAHDAKFPKITKYKKVKKSPFVSIVQGYDQATLPLPL
jgi:hypothetical protein